MKNTYKVAVILLAAYISMLLVQNVMNHTDANIGLAVFVMVFMFVVLYMTLYWMPRKVYGWIYRKTETDKKEKPMPKIEIFEDLLKRGNLPDDDRVVPHWLKIKNRQFDDIDVTHNNVDSIVSLTNEEFNEFVTSVNTDMFLVYLSTVSKSEMKKFYSYLDAVVKTKEDVEAPSAKDQFLSAMNGIETSTISDESRARATLEIPLMITFAKNIYHKIIDFTEYISQDYYDYNSDDSFKIYEGSLSTIIWNDMKYIPDNFEQVLDHFKENFYDEENEDHQKFVKHLAKRFGLLIATLNNLILKTENRNSSLNWFTGVMMEQKLLTSGDISVSKTKSLSTDQKLINFHALTFLAIVDENDDNYLSNLIAVVKTMFEYYPVNREACEYVMVEMMKSVAIKEVNVDNANSFIAFFEKLPRFYELLSYDNIYELKELIGYTLSNEKPQDNKVFEEKGVKNKLILLNYLVDMEDLYYESGRV